MATVINTIDQFEATRTDAVNKGKAYVVPEEVFRHFSAKLYIKALEAEEVAELEELLGQSVDNVDAMGLTRSCVCPRCSHEFTFADHFRAAIESGVHTREQLIEFTTSSKEGRYYLVVDTDQKIDVSCTDCKGHFAAVRCCYTTSSYAYA